ncbi:MAG TPA: beta-xylosidase [Bryobacteraceae bacterium]|jgi:xylan 1,4-beta-xylosidase
MRQSILSLFILFTLIAPISAQPPITIHVSANERIGPFKPVWTYFGYDEANYTYTSNGRKLIRELSELSHTPVYIRTHNLLTTGNGIPALKWSSTNAYTEDAAGKPVYDWTIIDKIFDTYLAAGAKPFVEIGFMPEALSTHPQPYRHTWPKGGIDTGWAYPPTSYAKWDRLIYEWVRHCLDKYGQREVESWFWEVWNEPDIFYWHGTPEQYDELYDHTAAAVKRALRTARVGGPASTGPANPKAAGFLRQFLQHCAAAGSPLDFISYHAKGRPEVVDGRIRMGLSQQLQDVAAGFAIIREFQQFRGLPIFLSESDPEGCAACSAQTHPQNAYRNGALYPVYLAETLDKILKLAARDRANLAGMLTWAFEFEDQPYFAGFRTLATNGIDKPVLNFFRMAGLMRGDIVQAENDRDVNALAVRSENNVSVMVWNYGGDSMPAPPAEVETVISGIPPTAGRVLLEHYRIDRDHSNSYTAWQKMRSPQHPTSGEYAKLEAAGQLQMLASPRWVTVRNGALNQHFSLERQGLSLLRLSW